MLTIRDAGILSTSYSLRTQPVDTLVLHYTELNLDESLRILRSGGVSAHLVLDEDGTAYRLLPNDQVAWHAGLSSWQDQSSVNARSIGIEIVNRNGNRYPYPEAQITALIQLCRKILAENPAISPRNVVGHSDIAPRRKVDPGRLFPWKTLADSGIGVWPYDAHPEPVGAEHEIRRLLKACGYPLEHAYGRQNESFVAIPDPENPPVGVSDIVQVTLQDIVTAFQLHYEPNLATGIVTATTMGLLRKLSSMAIKRHP